MDTPQAQGVAVGFVQGVWTEHGKVGMCTGLVQVWAGARGGKKRDTELLGIKVLNSTLVFHIIVVMCICQA